LNGVELIFLKNKWLKFFNHFNYNIIILLHLRQINQNVMRKIFIIFILLTHGFANAQKIIDSLPFNKNALVLEQSNSLENFISIDTETKYIEEHISNFRGIRYKNTVYLNWNICEDFNNSDKILISKSIDGIKYRTIYKNKIIDSNQKILQTQLLSQNFSDEIDLLPVYYRLYRINDNKIIHIATLIITH